MSINGSDVRSPYMTDLSKFLSIGYMGRVKLELKRIEKSTNRQITYSKRKKGLIKKAYELSTLCDIDLALLMFSPSDRLCLFSGQKRIEDVFARYINLPDQERENAIVFPDQSKRQLGIQHKEYLLRTLEQLKTQEDMALHINEPRPLLSDVEALEQEVCRLQEQLQISEEELRKFEPDPVRFTSMEEIEACETHLINTLTRVVQRREHLLNKSCKAPSTQQSIEGIPINNVVDGWSVAEPEQANMIASLAHHSSQLRSLLAMMICYCKGVHREEKAALCGGDEVVVEALSVEPVSPQPMPKHTHPKAEMFVKS